jgi:DNA-binding transcriptional ArsR family regulator
VRYNSVVLDAVLHAVAEPRRREILRLVRERELSSGAIAAHFDVTRPAISQHLGVLAAAGLVSVRRLGTQRLYQLRPEGLSELRAFLDEFWDARLARLAAEAEAEEAAARWARRINQP